jgi:hypothetical protein
MNDDPIQNSERTHWDELAEKLGLAPAAMPSVPAVSRPKVAEEPPNAKAPRSPELAPRVEDLEDEEPSSEEIPLPVAQASSLVSSSAAAAEPDQEEPSTRPKRRRGRKGGKSARSTEKDVESQSPIEPSDEQSRGTAGEAGDTDRRRRGRGRGQRKKAIEPDDNKTSAGVDDESNPTPVADDKDEVDNLSDWNVPSWAELIGSLHRVER